MCYNRRCKEAYSFPLRGRRRDAWELQAVHLYTSMHPGAICVYWGDRLVITAEEVKVWEAIKRHIDTGQKVQIEKGRDGIKLISLEAKIIKIK